MDLYDEVRRATSDEQVIEAIRQWVNIECSHLDQRSRPEQRAQLIAATAGSDSHWRAELIEVAKNDPDIWEGLRRYALQQAQEGQSIEPDLAVLVLSDAPKRKRGRQEGGTPFIETLSMIYARAVWCVYHGSTRRYTLSAYDTHTNNAFSLVAKVTGASFDEVRNACKGQLGRLTQIYRHAEKNYINWHPGHSRNTNNRQKG